MTLPTHRKTMLSRLAAFDRARALIAPGDRILAAVSGGPDSVCLAHYLAGLTRRRKVRVELAYVDHGLRGAASRADGAFVQSLGRRLGLKVHVRKAAVRRLAKEERRSVEDAARVLRYRILGNLARRLGFNKVATGHQLDDQAETVLLHLLRGTKARGLAGAPPKRPLRPGVLLVRPLLPLTRAEILGYLSLAGLPHRVDETNSSDRHTRNWVRRKVLPLLESRNPRIREHLAAIAEDAQKILRS